MSSMFGAGFGVIFALPILIAQWVGVIGLSKRGRNGAWWCMAVGTGLSTLGSILTPVIIFLLSRNSGGIDNLLMLVSMVGGVAGLGSLVFVVGFAIHGLRSKRIEARVEELETVLAAQGEQLNRQNSGGLS